MAAALGLVPHTGWCWLVRVADLPNGVAVERRERVAACDVLEGELYHRAAEMSGDAAVFIATRRAEAVQQARAALEPYLRGAREAVVLGKTTTLPPLERILAVHPMIHAAEGELWRGVFAEACSQAGLRATRREASAVRETLARTRKAADVQAFLSAGRRAVGAPWSREPQDAALAAWSALATAP